MPPWAPVPAAAPEAALLRALRALPAAIEDRNNRLELHSRNNQRLLETMEGLVGCLALSDKTEDVLRYTSFSGAK